MHGCSKFTRGPSAAPQLGWLSASQFLPGVFCGTPQSEQVPETEQLLPESQHHQCFQQKWAVPITPEKRKFSERVRVSITSTIKALPFEKASSSRSLCLGIQRHLWGLKFVAKLASPNASLHLEQHLQAGRSLLTGNLSDSSTTFPSHEMNWLCISGIIRTVQAPFPCPKAGQPPRPPAQPTHHQPPSASPRF